MRYLIITYVKRPNGQMDELVAVGQRVKPKDLSMASVILDFKNRLVLKSSVGDQVAPRDFQRIRDFYHQHYSDVITELEGFFDESTGNTD